MNAQKLYAASASRIATLKFIRIVLNCDMLPCRLNRGVNQTIINYQCCKSAQYYLMKQANKYQYQQLIPNADI